MTAFPCPTQGEIVDQALALLPRGRAWQTHEGGPRPGSTLYRFWSAVAEPFAFLHERLCALRMEFWCATHSETNDLWMAEYGLPDACDPYPDLCAKVAAIGGARCEDYRAIAARAGWQIDCVEPDTWCGGMAGNAQAGCDFAGGLVSPAALTIRVYLDRSPAYTGPLETGPFAGALQAGLPLACDPDITPLVCLLERVVHAHLAITYEVVTDA